jgi:DNA-binding beta-propeller fold protein YncE
VAIVASAGRGFITDGADASVIVFDLKTYAVLGKVKTADDSDGVIYDPASGKILVVCGDAGVMIPISPELDLATGKADTAVELGGKPEFLAADGRGKALINGTQPPAAHRLVCRWISRDAACSRRSPGCCCNAQRRLPGL